MFADYKLPGAVTEEKQLMLVTAVCPSPWGGTHQERSHASSLSDWHSPDCMLEIFRDLQIMMPSNPDLFSLEKGFVDSPDNSKGQQSLKIRALK